MQGIVEALPELLGTIQAQLLDLLSLVLAGRPYRDTIHPSHLAAYHAAVTHGMHQSECVALSSEQEQSMSDSIADIDHAKQALWPGMKQQVTSLLHQRLCCLLLPSMHNRWATGHVLPAGELQGAALTRLALQTLGSFDFGSMRLHGLCAGPRDALPRRPRRQRAARGRRGVGEGPSPRRQHTPRLPRQHISEPGTWHEP